MSVATQNASHWLYCDCDVVTPDIHLLPEAMVVAVCQKCPGKAEANDDSAALIQTAVGDVVLVVADGVGGGPSGHKASGIAVQSIADRVLAGDGDLRPAILDGIEAANDDILRLGTGAATTLTVVQIQAGRARGYHIGDSQAMVIGQRGLLKWKSIPHSPVGYGIQSGMLDEGDAMYHEDRHVVSNVLGSRAMHIEIGPSIPLAPRDSVILGSDGLFDNLGLDEVIQIAKNGPPLRRVLQLQALTLRRMNRSQVGTIGKPDDLTILLHTHRNP